MATSNILDTFASSTSITITLASLATSTTGVGRQSTIIDNTTNRYTQILLFLQIKQGTSPTGNKGVYVYLIRDDNNSHRDDGAGTTDAALTVLNAPYIGAMRNKSSPSTGDVLYGTFLIEHPGPKWGIAIVHDTGVNLDSTEGNHVKAFVGINLQNQ